MLFERSSVLATAGTPTKPPAAAVGSRFLSVAAAARLLGTSEVTLYRAIHSGEFPAIKIRGRYVIPGKALDEMESAALGGGFMVDAADWATSPAAGTRTDRGSIPVLPLVGFAAFLVVASAAASSPVFVPALVTVLTVAVVVGLVAVTLRRERRFQRRRRASVDDRGRRMGDGAAGCTDHGLGGVGGGVPVSGRWFGGLTGSRASATEGRGPVSLAETVAAVAGHYAGADPVVDVETARNARVWSAWPVESRSFGEAVAAAERFSDAEATLATAPPWSVRVDEAVHGMDAADPVGMDAWMQVHADSATPHLYEARLVAAWETRAAEAAEATAAVAEVQDVDEFADGW